ncbi:DUF4158 domain-containing protein [Pseudarthrobacter sulfonivorans]|nr:DUF4158 domain-containing protein [Pseudarthrobacter sulfonivorans]
MTVAWRQAGGSASAFSHLTGRPTASLPVSEPSRTHIRLGFAVQLAKVRVVSRFLTDPLAIPWSVVESLAGQLGIADASVLKLYAQRGQTGYEHAEEISAVYAYVDFADPEKNEQLKLFLSARAWTSPEGPVRLFERAAVWLGSP